MDKNKLVDQGIREIVYREGKAAEILPPVVPLRKQKLVINGTIGTISEFLSKRYVLFNPTECHIKIKNSKMTFFGNECQGNDQFITEVSGELIESDEFKSLGLESETYRKPTELARFLKKRKNLFPDKEQFSLVFTALSSFEAEVSRQLKEMRDNKTGSMESSIKQDVTSNVPNCFSLMLPIFKGADPIRFEVEIDIDPNTLECVMLTFDLDAKIENQRNELIINELNTEISEGLILNDFCVVYNC